MKWPIVLSLIVSVGANAQTAPDFTITDIDGNSRNLYTQLAANNIVVLKFFTNWCSICNNTASEVVAIYNNHQAAQDPVVFWALNRDPNETNADAAAFRDNHAIPFPVIGEAYAVAQQYGVIYQPEYYIIRPNKTYVKQSTYSAMETAVQEALSAHTTGIFNIEQQHALQLNNTAICWRSEVKGNASLVLYDLAGRLASKQAVQTDVWTTLNCPSGIYTYTLSRNNQILKRGKLALFQ